MMYLLLLIEMKNTSCTYCTNELTQYKGVPKTYTMLGLEGTVFVRVDCNKEHVVYVLYQ